MTEKKKMNKKALFGVVALVALTPLIAIQIMGLVFKYKTKQTTPVMLQSVEEVEAEDTIYEFEGE